MQTFPKGQNSRLSAMTLKELISYYELDQGTDLVGSDLSGDSFRGQDLTFINFSQCDMRGCDFTGADVEFAMFVGTKLSPGALEQAHNLDKAIFLEVTES